MALHGKFVISDADYAPLSFPSVGTFLAFSGNGDFDYLSKVLHKTTMIQVPCSNFKAYGTITVW